MCLMPASKAREFSENEKLACTTLRVASSRKASSTAWRSFPFASGIFTLYIPSACTHSRGEKNSNFSVFSSAWARIRRERSRPAERTSREREELEGLERI